VSPDPIDFAEFYERCRADCRRAVHAVVGDPAQAEDLVAEGFARAWASWDKVGRHPAPEAWVIRTCLNANISWWRRRRREVAWKGQVGASVPPSEGDGVDPRVMAALRALPLRQREVLALRVFLDLDTRATAAALGLAPGTVRAHLHRATSTLRQQFAPRTEPERTEPERTEPEQSDQEVRR
jgi:RNA polymerase sigma-70 factor (sigma-E family)